MQMPDYRTIQVTFQIVFVQISASLIDGHSLCDAEKFMQRNQGMVGFLQKDEAFTGQKIQAIA